MHNGRSPKFYMPAVIPAACISGRDEGNLGDTIPPGYEIYENPNVQVFLRKLRPQIIMDEEYVKHLGEESFYELY